MTSMHRLLCCRTFIKEDPFNIAAKASDDGLALVVKSVSAEHSHEINEVSRYRFQCES